jgi:hypothetical protein
VLINALMAPELRTLITDFRAAQDRAIDFLHTNLSIPLPQSGPDWVRNGHRAVLDALKLAGDSAFKLAPHGYGIDVIHSDFRIDFDYGPNGEIDCFDVWRLALHRYYLTHAKPPVGPYDDIREWVNDAVAKSELRIVPETYNAFFQDPTLLRAPDAVHGLG